MKFMNILLGLVLLFTACAPVGETDFGITNQKTPEQGVLFGGQPTVEQLQALGQDGGFKTIIDLRGLDEDRGFDEAAVVAEAGMSYVLHPVTRETMEKDVTYESFILVFDDAEKPVLVHCASGNRVGALYYAWLVAKEEMPRNAALEKAKENGLKSMPLVKPIDRFLDAR